MWLIRLMECWPSLVTALNAEVWRLHFNFTKLWPHLNWSSACTSGHQREGGCESIGEDAEEIRWSVAWRVQGSYEGLFSMQQRKLRHDCGMLNYEGYR